MMKQIIDQIRKSSSILVASHAHPDGDAVGSLLATGLAFTAMGKDARMLNESPIPAVYRFLPWINAIQQHLVPDVTFDTAVVLDCSDIERIGSVARLIRDVPVIINIDHHVTNTGFGHYHLIDTQACATAEIVYRLIEALAVPIDNTIAAAIYTGILTDTGSFRFSNTTRSAFEICARMIAHGADPYQIAQHVYGTYSLGRIKLLNLALDSLEISANGLLSMMTLTQRMLEETRTQPEDIDGIINYARRIEDVKVAALIHELADSDQASANEPKTYHVSLRSDGAVDVSKIAARYGGGGHFSASGFSARTTLTKLRDEMMRLSESIPNLCALN
jgi:phosphoesterase RecJ-like protein